MRTDRLFKFTLVGVVGAWLFIFALLPFALVVLVSFTQGDSSATILNFHFTLSNYTAIFNTLYLNVFVKSLYLAGVCTLFCLILGYPLAYWLTRLPTNQRNLLLLLIIIPFWTSSLVRSYAMMVLLKNKGILNSLLIKMGIIHQPLELLFTNSAVLLTLIYNLLPFMILPLYANLEKMDYRLLEAARDLGAGTATVFRRVVIPLSLPGIIAGCMLVLLPAMTIFYVPDMLGGAKSLLLGNLIENQFLLSVNWQMGSAVSIALIFCMGLLLLFYRRVSGDTRGFI